MDRLNSVILTFQDRDYSIVEIPDVITNKNRTLFIGSHSLHLALYNEEVGYINEAARIIDEQVYAYLDDVYFSLGDEEFIDKVKEYLD